MKNAMIGSAILLALAALPRAEAAPLYTTTDLGSSYQLLANASGHDYGVTGPLGVTYAFDKAPVIPINIQSISSDWTNQTVLTMHDGAFQAGYGHALTMGVTPYNYYPSFAGLNYGWDTLGPTPVSDMNLKGQVVGTGDLGSSSWPSAVTGTYAAFSAVGVTSHLGGIGSEVDNLNNYIVTIPEVYLTSAVAIDDLGRIIAFGSNNDAYLLTPTALGAPATVPEPSTGLMLGMAFALVGLRSLRPGRQRIGSDRKSVISSNVS